MSKLFKQFFAWYQHHYALNITIATGLFLLQIVHLTWLALHVIGFKLTGHSLWNPSLFWQNIIIVVDYTEIPALLSTSLIYINEIRKSGLKLKPVFYIFALYIQFIHIFWITDEFVLTTFTGEEPVVMLPAWAAWIAIMIDYLEVPVIFDTTKRFFLELNKKGAASALKIFRT